MSASQRTSRSSIWLSRLILWLSLWGMVLAVHLWIQRARGFDQGCLGLSKHPITTEAGCQEVGDLPASHLFGVSNAAWGYGFYFALALIAFSKLLVPGNWVRRLHILSEVVVATGFAYSGYLVYQMGFVAHAWCALCLISAITVLVLSLAHLAVRWRDGIPALDSDECSTERALAAGSLFGAMGLLVGVVVFVDRLGTRALDEGTTASAITRLVGQALPVYIDSSKLADMRACHFDADAPRLDLGRFLDASTPFIGKPDGIPVVVFFDPNCPHCREYLPTYLQVVEKYRDRMRFTILPRLLWEESIPQAEALMLAEGSGKYFDVWKRMLARAGGPGSAMTMPEIKALFHELGLDTANLSARLAEKRSAAVAARDQARIAGIDGVPAVYIGPRKVWGPNRSEQCLGTLIERMLSTEAKPVREGSR